MREKIKSIVSRLAQCHEEDCQGCKAYVDEICGLIDEEWREKIESCKINDKLKAEGISCIDLNGVEQNVYDHRAIDNILHYTIE